MPQIGTRTGGGRIVLAVPKLTPLASSCLLAPQFKYLHLAQPRIDLYQCRFSQFGRNGQFCKAERRCSGVQGNPAFHSE